MGENSRCAGTLEMVHQGEWRPVVEFESQWDQKSTAAVCRMLDCGSAVSSRTTYDSPDRLVWWIKPFCVHLVLSLSECALQTHNMDKNYIGIEVICSGNTSYDAFSMYYIQMHVCMLLFL